jgi:alpha-1,2-mannosyltransferase
LSGTPVRVYDIATHLAAQRHAFSNAQLHYTALFYPPVCLLIGLLLVLLPYGWALIVWLAITGALFLASLSRFLEDNVLSVLAFPAVWLNVVHGQNGFLTTAPFAGATWCLETRPVVAGILLGSLIYKPHFLWL